MPLSNSRWHRWGLAALAGAVLALGAAFAQSPAPGTAASQDAIRKAFAEADANRDGVLNIDEFIANVIYIFKQIDTNRDGFITETEVIAYSPNYRPEAFKAADRNGDGKLSVGEVVAAKVIEFFEIDTNRDGVITIDEVLVYERTVRGAPGR